MSKFLAIGGVVLASGLMAAGLAQTVPPDQAAQAVPSGAKPHIEIPDTETATCQMCHEDVGKAAVPHGALDAGGCTVCHDFSGAGEETRIAFAAGATSGNTAPLCAMCHEDIAGLLKAPHVHGPAAAGECTTCHAPHGSETAGLLTAPALQELCTMCHADVGEDLAKKTPHKPAVASCTLCHDAHGSPNPAQLREVVNPLCEACHALPASFRAKPDDSIPLGKDHTVPASALPMTKQVDLDRRGRGHPIANHPTRGDTDPAQKERPFTCLSCHAAHGTDVPMLLGFGLKPGEGICQKCHEM